MVQQVESAEDAAEQGIEIIIDLEKAQSTSVEDLEAQTEFIAGTAEAVASGEISAEDAQSATENLDEVDSTLAAGLIDPNVILLNKLKNLLDSPESKKSLELFKESILTVDELVKSLPESEQSAFLADMLVDPSFFEKVIDVYVLNSSLPPILFQNLES